MNDSNFEMCSQCGGEMRIVSPENTSPLITECTVCGNRQTAEVQISPPWPPAEEPVQGEPVTDEQSKSHRMKHFPHGMPVTVGDPDEEGTIIHFGCLVLGIVAVALLAALIWWLL